MYVDAELKFSSGNPDGSETLSGALNTLVAFSSSVDQKRAGEDIGNGQPIYLVAVVVSGTLDAAVDIDFISDDNSGLTSPTSHAKIGQLASGATAGDGICGALPATFGSSQEVERYIGAGLTARGGAVSTGDVKVFLTTTPQKFKVYPKSYTITG